MRTASVVLLVLLVGCASIPKRQIESYVDAYHEVAMTAELIYRDFSDRQRADAAASAPAPFSARYLDIVPKNIEDTHPENTGEVVSANRLRALRAGADYNEALLALASGRSAEEVRLSASRLAELLTTFTGVPAAGTALVLVAKQLENARTRQELIAALQQEITVDGRTDHPVNMLLDYLHRDTKLLYEWRFEKFRDEALRPIPTETAEAQATALARRHALVEDMLQYHQTLVRYRGLLEKTKQYFASVRAAVNDPASDLQAAEFVALVIDLRSDARAVRDAFRRSGTQN
jgi:hypothetical protein